MTRSIVHIVLASLFFGCGAAEQPVARNVILVSLDTLRSDHIGCYGYERDTSPHIDGLCGDAIVFDRAIAQSASTLPSHRSLFQSKPASKTRKNAFSFVEALARESYKTTAFTGGEMSLARWVSTAGSIFVSNTPRVSKIPSRKRRAGLGRTLVRRSSSFFTPTTSNKPTFPGQGHA